MNTCAGGMTQGMAITLGGVSSVLVSFSGTVDEPGKLISSSTIDTITCIYAPLSIIMMAYALFTYEWRGYFLRKKQVRAGYARQRTLLDRGAGCGQLQWLMLAVVGAEQIIDNTAD